MMWLNTLLESPSHRMKPAIGFTGALTKTLNEADWHHVLPPSQIHYHIAAQPWKGRQTGQDDRLDSLQHFEHKGVRFELISNTTTLTARASVTQRRNHQSRYHHRQTSNRDLEQSIRQNGQEPIIIGGANVAAELDAKRAIDEGIRKAASI